MKGGLNNKRKEGGAPSNSLNRNTSNANSSGGFYETEEITKGFNDRLNYLLINSISHDAVVTVTSGVKYAGLLVACNPDSVNGVDVVLKFPKIIDKSFDGEEVDRLSNSLKENLIIKGSDVAELELTNIDFSLNEKWEKLKKEEVHERQAEASRAPETKKSYQFKTDVDISGGNAKLKERELQKWVPDDHETFDINDSLENEDASWNQFAVNEEKFGIKSTFDEHLYTTRINKNDPHYQEKLKEADRIAKEIESQGPTSNVHLAEDRGLIVDDSGMDEEDKYSGVDRRGGELLAALKMNADKNPPKPKKYVPPTLRNQPHHNDPAIISSVTAENVIHKSERNSHSKAHLPQAPRKLSDKKTHIDELREFSEKFKVPYEMPEEVKTIFKKGEGHSPQITASSLKHNPSLPPKPVSQTSSGSTSTSSNKNTRNSKPPTPNVAKAELRRNSSRMNSQGQTPAPSPSSNRYADISRRRNTSSGSFFGAKAPQFDGVKKDLTRNFNVFLKSKEAYDKEQKIKKNEAKTMEPFFVGKPYFTAPTWTSTIEQSYKSFFPDKRTAIQRSQMKIQQRNFNAMANAGNTHMVGMPGMMMGMPMGPNGSPTPFLAGPPSSGGMYMPFQPPGFYPPAMQMMPVGSEEMGSAGGSPSPNPASPHAMAAFMNGGASSVPMTPFGYPGTMPFQPMMGGGNYRQNYHHNNSNNQHHNRHHRSHDR